MEPEELYFAHGYDHENRRAGGVWVGILHGRKSVILDWLEATRPGWKEDHAAGRALLQKKNVLRITPEKLEVDRAEMLRRRSG